jgi:hypothetical protein
MFHNLGEGVDAADRTGRAASFLSLLLAFPGRGAPCNVRR